MRKCSSDADPSDMSDAFGEIRQGTEDTVKTGFLYFA